MEDNRQNPAEVAEQLLNGTLTASDAPRKESAATVTVSLAVNNGNFRLEWQSSDIGKYDFIGMYKNTSAEDGDYIGTKTSGPWQWASNGTSYDTSESVRGGYQARYLIWDGSKYRSIARTPAFPERVTS
jgi:hypothetical protein